MKCDEFSRIAGDLVRNQALDSEKKLAAVAHAEICPACSRRLEQEKGLALRLQALSRAMASEEAPVWVEEQLLSRFRRMQQSAETSSRRSWARVSGAIAAGIVLLIFSGYLAILGPSQPDKRQGGTDLGKASPRAVAPAAGGERELRPWVVTGFIPLVDGYSTSPPERGHLFRIRLDRTALIWMGLPMNEESAESSVLADVLVGDDGLARAVRFVR